VPVLTIFTIISNSQTKREWLLLAGLLTTQSAEIDKKPPSNVHKTTNFMTVLLYIRAHARVRVLV
jgi:hypothetical protein